VTINVVDENDVPVLNVNAGTSVVEGGSVLITSTELSVSDEDELPEEITYSIIDAPTAGRLELVDDPGIAISTFTQADIDNSQVRFVHDGSEADDSFTFTTSDGSGGTIGTTLFSIANLRVNDAPVNTTPAAQIVDEDSPLVFSPPGGNSIAVSDVDLNGGMIGVRLVATNGTLTLSSTTGLVFANGDGDQNLSMVFAGTLADVNSALDGLRFDPAADFNGAASIRIVSRDMGASGSGGEQIDDDTINIEVVPVNDNPIATDDEYSTSEDNSLTVSAANGLLSNDSDIDGDDLVVTLGTGTANGTLSLNADGSFIYTPNANFNGTDSFTYQATDGSLVSEIQTVTLTVTSVNDASVSIDDEFTVDQLSVLKVRATDGVLVNDLDIEADGLQAILVDGPQNGKLVLNADGSLTYTPNATFFGEDTFTYQAFDGTDDGSIATVRIDVLQTVTSGGDGGDSDIVVEKEAETSDGDEAVDGDNGTTDAGPDAAVDDTGEVSTESTLTAPPTVNANEDTGSTTATTDPQAEVEDGSANGSGNEQPLFEAAFRIDERGELRDRLTGRIIEDAGVVVFTSTDVGSMVYVLEQTGFWTELDTFEQDVQNSILQEGEWEELVVETTTVAGTTLTVGYIVWLLRSGSVVFGLVSSLPAWTMMDPLPVLQSGLEGLDETDNTDDDSLQGILQAHHDGMELPAESFES
jgi:large repetitive protein